MFQFPLPPYYADSASLPAALPTEAQIRGSKDILSERGGGKTVRVGHHFVVKYGNLDVIEAHNMIFVGRKTKIPVPTVYAIFTSADKKVLYIIMKYIHGSPLSSEWPGMSKLQKDIVCKKLKAYFEELRRIRAPGYYGSLGYQRLLNGMFWTGEGANRNPAINGPFQTESDLNEALVQKSKSNASRSGRDDSKPAFYHRALPSVFHGHKPVFTHGDFQRKNIIVSKIPVDMRAGGSTVEDYQVTMIDWEMSGWYPSYWEYCMTAICFRWDDDWPSRVESILQPYWTEFPWLHMLFNELWS